MTVNKWIDEHKVLSLIAFVGLAVVAVSFDDVVDDYFDGYRPDQTDGNNVIYCHTDGRQIQIPASSVIRDAVGSERGWSVCPIQAWFE